MLHAIAANLLALIALIGLAADAQKTVVVLTPAAGMNPLDDVLASALENQGWVQNRNVRIATRHWGGNVETLQRFVAEILTLKPDVVAAWGPQGAHALKRATSEIPIVFLTSFTDAIEVGLVSNVARPGGNITGVSVFSTEMDAKRMQLLKEVMPSLQRVALLGTREQSVSVERKSKLAATARQFKIEVIEEDVDSPSALEAAIARLKQRGAQALYVWPTGITFSYGRDIARFALTQGLPSVHGYSESALAGGLLSYAPPLDDVARRGAVYVDRILRGAKPADMPIEQPSKIEFIVNQRSARALGLAIPQRVLLRADRVVD
ncbi:MAG: ABC transporter substrate-binding protein [Burkholderiales bacterium]